MNENLVDIEYVNNTEECLITSESSETSEVLETSEKNEMSEQLPQADYVTSTQFDIFSSELMEELQTLQEVCTDKPFLSKDMNDFNTIEGFGFVCVVMLVLIYLWCITDL